MRRISDHTLTIIIRQQHLVSKVVLRRFTNPHGELLDINVQTGRTRRLHPSASMYEIDYISAAPNEAERLWATVEERMPRAYASIDNNTILQDPVALQTLKDCIALHFIRSYMLKRVTQVSTAGAIAQMRGQLTNEGQAQVLEEFLRQTGIQLAGPEGLAFAVERILATIKPALSSAQEFWERVKVHFQDVRRWCAGLALEIISPQHVDDEFLIGDTPALSYKAGNFLGGPLTGVPLSEAAAVYMPIGPRHLVSLAKQGGQFVMDRSQVGLVNHMQVLNAQRHACARLGSGLIVRSVVS